MIPWLALPPCTVLGKMLTEYLLLRDWSLTRVRKIVQSCCFLAQNTALLIMCGTSSFHTSLICMTIIIGGTGFHNSAVVVNPQDLSPLHSGSIYGLMNTFGSIPGKFVICRFLRNQTDISNEKNPFSGFLGVYLAGHILELTQSWSAVFSTAAFINSIGWVLYLISGSAQKIA